VKIHGIQHSLRGANKKYYQLDDMDELYEKLQLLSIGALAKELGVPQNSIRHRVMKYFPPEWIANIKKDRRYKQEYNTDKI
jgi:hypothetical protein